jgi:hypothetical protein
MTVLSPLCLSRMANQARFGRSPTCPKCVLYLTANMAGANDMQAVGFITALHIKTRSRFIYDRSATKARTRDAIGRLQKSFLSRRRLEMLSKGLIGQGREKTLSTSTGKDFENKSSIAIVDLAHGKRNIQLPQ